MKYTWNGSKTVEGWNGKPIKFPRREDPEDENSPVVTVDATIRDVMTIIVGNAQFRTIEDSKEGRRLAEALEESKKSGVISLDQGTHNWLKKQSETIAPQVFRLSGEIVDNLIREGFEKAFQPKERE